MLHVNYLAVSCGRRGVRVGWLWVQPPVVFSSRGCRCAGMDPVAAMAGAKMPAGSPIECAGALVLRT